MQSRKNRVYSRHTTHVSPTQKLFFIFIFTSFYRWQRKSCVIKNLSLNPFNFSLQNDHLQIKPFNFFVEEFYVYFVFVLHYLCNRMNNGNEQDFCGPSLFSVCVCWIRFSTKIWNSP